MTLKSGLLFTTLAVLCTLCYRPCFAQIDIAITNKRDFAKGDTVKELGDSLWIVFQDSKYNYWFGSNGEGVYRFDGTNVIRFTTQDGLSNDSIRHITEDKTGSIFFATRNGVCKFDGHKFSTLSPIVRNSSAKEWTPAPDDLWFPGNQEVNGLYRYDDQSLYHLHLPKSDLEDEFYASIPNPPYKPYQAYCVCKDSRGNMWIGTSSFGVCRYDGKSFSWITEDRLAESPVRSIIENKNGYMWFGNSGQGLYRYDGKNLIEFRKEKGIGNLKELPADFPVSYNSITEDNNGELWIATYSCGVWRFDGENVTHYPVKDGNRDVTVYSIYKDRQGDLWLGTIENGAFKFNGKEFERFRL